MKTIIYRLYTESRANLAMLSNSVFPNGFSLFQCEGIWHDKREPCAMIEIIGDNSKDTRNDVYHLARHIKSANAQESVIVTESEVTRIDV